MEQCCNNQSGTMRRPASGRMPYQNMHDPMTRRPGCSCGMPAAAGGRMACRNSKIAEHADALPLTMGYVPMQRFGRTFELCRGLQCGTIFPELCKTFCGRGGARRC